jgi:Caspase domain
MKTKFIMMFFAAAIAMIGTTKGAETPEKRFALLIGNQAYDASVGVLKNPHNDIQLVSEALRKQGFQILPLIRDARRSSILGGVRDLVRQLNLAGAGAIGFLYYSGHGAAEKDTNINYLIPVDARDPGSAAFWDESVKLDDIMRLLDGARGAVKFVVFDACRNELQLPTRDTSKGLVPVPEQQGFFVAYASAPGRTASDRGAASGPYAAALAKELAHQGLDHLNLFQNVKEIVIASTGGSQQPWESNGLTRRVYLTGEPTMPAEIALWESVRASSDIASLKKFIDRFPNGVFAGTAAQMIERLKSEVAQREAAKQFDIERKAQEAKQVAELQTALDDARKAREALSLAERQRAQADSAAEQARTAVTAAQAERNAAALREQELRQAQQQLSNEQANSSTKSAAERAAATAGLERQLAAVASEARAARDALAVAEAKQKAAEQAALEARTATQAAGQRNAELRVAALPDVGAAATGLELQPDELARRLQAELKRVGCYAGDVDGNWGAGSRHSLEAFVRTTGFPIKELAPSADALTAVSSQRVRICPLHCASGEVDQGGKCIVARPREPDAKVRDTSTGGVSVPRRIQAAPPANLSAYSLGFWPRHSLKLGQTVTTNTPFGVLTCTSVVNPGPRNCSLR